MSDIYIEDQHLGIGNNGTNISFNYFDALPDNSLLSNIKDANLLLNIKQLFKKDDTTKEKALNKILELLNSNTDLIKEDINILVWSMIYPKLVISGSKNVTILANEVATVILKYVKENKLKQLLPYFQDLFPILIFGISDLDKKVSRATKQNLNSLFNNEQSKIDGLYQHFRVNLLRIVYSILCIETEETLYNFDSSSKESEFINSIKNRHINLKISAINLLTELIEKNDYKFIIDNEYLQEIMTNKEMYEMLTMKFIQKYGINGPKAILRLTILIVSKKTKVNNKELRTEYWSVSSNKKIMKLIAKNIFKLLNEWNESKQQLLSALTVDVILLLNSFEDIDGFWEVAKSPYESLYKWLGLGPGIFTPINYYRELERFTVDMCTKNQDSNEFETHWIKIWDSGFEKELKRRDRFGNEFLEQFWVYFISLNQKFNDFDAKAVSNKMMATVMKKKVNEKLMTIFTKAQSSFYSDVEEQIKHVLSKDEHSHAIQDYPEVKTFVTNALMLLISSSHENNIFIDAGCSDQALNVLLETILENKDLENFVIFVNSSKFDPSVYMKSLFIPFLHKMDPSKVSNTISKIRNKELIKEAVDEDVSLQSILFNSNELVSLDLMTMKTVVNFHETLDNFEFFNKFNTLSEALKIQYLLFNPSYVEEFATTAYDLDNHDWYDLLSDCCNNNKFVSESVLKYLETEFIKNIDDEEEKYLIEIITDLIADNEECVLDYLKMKNNFLFLEKVFKGLEFIDDRLVSVAGLNSSSILFKDYIQDGYYSINQYQFEKDLKSLKFAAVLIQLLPDLNALNEDVCFINYNIIKLLTTHYSIIMNNDEIVFTFDDYKFNIIKMTPTLCDIENFVLNQSATNTYLDLLSFEDSTPALLKFYKTKLMSMIINNVIDETPESVYKVNVTNNNIENVILKCLRNADVLSNFDNTFVYLLCYLTSIHETYNYNDQFTKLTSYIMSEFHQLKPEQFENVTYKYLIILINLAENHDASESPKFNEMRFNGFIKNIVNLYEDIDWYEDESNYKKYLRSLFLRLFINLNNYSSLKAQVLEFSQNLITENLQICELIDANENSSSDLLEHSLKLLNFVEMDEFLMEEVCENVFNIFTQEKNLETDLIEGCLLTYANPKFLNLKFDELIDILKNATFGLNKKRLAFLLLDKIFKTERYINCIDFELGRKEIIKSHSELSSKMNDLDINNNSSNSVDVNIDDELKKKYRIDEKILQLLDVFENESIISYIWTIGLIMTSLENTTLNLFNLFMTQLGTNWFMEKWFEKVYLKVNDEDGEINIKNTFSIDGGNEIKNITYRICKLLTSKSSLSGIYTWYNNFEKSESEHYSEYFTKYISKHLIEEQMEELQNNKLLKELKDEFSEFLTIEVKPDLNLVKAKFDIDEQTLDIFYQYENDFPLKPIKATVKNNKIGINDKTLKTWLLTIKKTPVILSNISTVCNNIKLKFANLEECAICYYVINDTNKSLPNKKCPTCTKKFHNVCLYKWFKNSNSNACPLCRSNFTF